MRKFSIDRARFEAMEARKKALSSGYGKIMEEISSVEGSLDRITGHIRQCDPKDREKARDLHQPSIVRHQRRLEQLERQKDDISRQNQNALNVFGRCVPVVAAADAAEAAARYEANAALGEQPVGRHRLKRQTEPVRRSSFFSDQVDRQVSEQQATASAVNANAGGRYTGIETETPVSLDAEVKAQDLVRGLAGRGNS